jgi:hypothetical protein
VALIGDNMTEKRLQQILQNLETLRTGIFKNEEAVNNLIDETIHLIKNDSHLAEMRVIQNTRKQRNKQIFIDRLNGYSFNSIAKEHSLSTSRVRQIFVRMLMQITNSREIRKILLPNDTKYWQYDIEYWQNNKEILLGYFV